MDILIISNNPLHAVQLIPIFNYLTMLSDFLFTEDYLTEANRTRNIPIINALYEYLENHRGDQSRKEELIRHLLRGSDFYEEEANENFDVIFVNAMFDYIISHLVFQKYGNIYGFLIDVFRKAENLQVNFLLNKMKEALKNATFEYDYGATSRLSNLSANRIYNDIILPHFPQPETNLSLLSLDYIYAHAGSSFLRSGRVNTTYYSDYKNYNLTDLNEEYFDEYLIMGRIIENLLNRKEIHFSTYKAFALPALACYISTKKEILKDVKTTNLIFDPSHWKAAYLDFSVYMQDSLEKIKKSFEIDYIYKMHIALSNFRNRAFFAKYVLDRHKSCDFLTAEEREEKIYDYADNAETFQCLRGWPLPNLNEFWMIPQVDNIGKIYKEYGRKIVQESLDGSFLRDLKFSRVSIHLLSPGDIVEIGNFGDSKQQPYDVLKFQFDNNRSEYYAFIWENYTVTFLRETDNPELFHQKIGLSVEELEKNKVNVVLKTFDEDIHAFWENLILYKSKRLRAYLYYADDFTEANETWKTLWWKEFGLSLAPFYTCLANAAEMNYHTENICSISNIKFVNKFQDDMSPRMIHKNTQNLLSSLGTTLEAVFSADSCDEIVNEVTSVADNHSFPLKNETLMQSTSEKFSMEIEKPGLEAMSITQRSMELLEKVIEKLKEDSDYKLISIENMLKNIKNLKSNAIKSIGVIGENNSRLMFVNALSYKSDTGYGYKFIYLSEKRDQTAHLRTVYDINVQKLILQKEYNKTRFMVLNNASLLPESSHYIYENHNQLRRSATKFSFSGISIDYDYNCDNDEYFETQKDSTKKCTRRHRYSEYIYQSELKKHIEHNRQLCEEFFSYGPYLQRYSPVSSKLEEFMSHCLEMRNVKEKFIMHNPELLNKLRYNLRFEEESISQADIEKRINSIYTYRERRKIEIEGSLDRIFNIYKQMRQQYAVNLEDFYAIRNYGTTGYTRINEDTNEAKRMQIALYKLAIRQSDDPPSEFNYTLFTIETTSIAAIFKMISHKKPVILKKFTMASMHMESAGRLVTCPPSGFENVMFEMHFSEAFMRAQIFQYYREREVIFVLLPETEFTMRNTSESLPIVDIKGLGSVAKIVLDFRNKFSEKDKWYNNIMKEITRLNS